MAHEYIKENDTFSTSRNGTVPKPTQAEVAYLRGRLDVLEKIMLKGE